MCCGPYDYEYPMMDNPNYSRMDPEYGRVGSIFSDPNVGDGVKPLTNSDVPIDESRFFNRDSETEAPELDIDGDSTNSDETTNPFNEEVTDGDINTSASYRLESDWE